MFYRLIPLALLVVAAPLVFAEPQRPVPEGALDVYTPAAFDEERVGGVFSDRMRANMEGYLEHADIAKLEKPFRERTKDSLDASLPEGAGLFLIAASESYEYSDDAQLKAVMDRMARSLMKSQEQDGYTGVYTKEARWGPGDTLTQASVLLGFVAYSRSTGDDDAEAAARKLANLLVLTFGQKHAPPEAAAFLPGIAELYHSTGDARYLEFAKSLALQQNGVNATTLVTVLRGYGLVELFRITGDDSYLQAAKNIWQKTEDEKPSVSGVPGSSDQVDSCMTLAWFQLTLDLLRLTGQVDYAAALENTVYNGLFPAQENNTGLIDATVPFAGRKKFGNGIDVCSAAAAVGIAEVPDVLWGRYGSGLAVLSYIPGRASIRLRHRGSVQLYAEGTYPESGSVVLHVEPSHDVKFSLRLYVPRWTHKFTVDVGGTHLSGTPGQFLMLRREWRRGDTVRIAIDMTAQVVSDPLTGKRVAVRRGPQLLALSSVLNPSLHDLGTVSLEKGAAATLKLDEGNNNPTMPATTYSIDGSESGKPVKLRMVPFSDATNYRVWLPAHGL